jgi:hypothetical protein
MRQPGENVSDRPWCDATVLITIPYARYFSSGPDVIVERRTLFGIVYAMLCFHDVGTSKLE